MIKQQKQQGMTLIEIMISLLIGVFLIGGVLQIFINTRQTYRMQSNLSGMQENGRFALSFFGNDMRMADFRKCPTSPSDPTAVAGTNDAGLNGSDTITVTWQDNVCAPPPPPPPPAPAPITRTYSIQAGASGQPGLFRSVNGAAADELIEGIENMQILYGEDTDDDGTPNYYVPANDVVGMSRVISIRVSLLVRSIDDNLTTAPRAYNYPLPSSTAITPGDKRLRRIFTSTIALRNRLP